MPLTEQQQLAVETIDKHVLVSAGAGSGKTHVLVERYMEILRRNPDLTITNLIAVTYTKKAANEMRVRLKARFKESILNSTDEEKLRWVSCLSEIDAAKIGTIHSLCEMLLKTFAVEAAIDSDCEVLDELGRTELLQKSIDQTFRDVISQQAPEQVLLRTFQLEELRRWLAQMMKFSLQLKESVSSIASLASNDFMVHVKRIFLDVHNRLLPSLLRNNSSALEYLKSNPHKDPVNKAEIWRRDVISFLEKIESLLPIGDESKMSELDGYLSELSVAVRGAVGGNSDEAKAIRANIKDIRENVRTYRDKYPTALVEADVVAFESIQQLFKLFERAMLIYEKEKAAALKLDFDDLIVRAQKTFDQYFSGEQPNKYIAAILVDEFQDTNKSQAGLIRALIGPQTKLFLIGDDKQSIYRFQGADISTFNQVKDSFNDQSETANWLKGPVAVSSLNKSFRSDPRLVAFVNAVFAELLKEESGQLHAARFEPLEAARLKNDERDRVDLVLYNGSVEDVDDGSISSSIGEAESVALWIKEKISEGALVTVRNGSGKEITRPIEYGDFAVLVQKNDRFGDIQNALANANIPHVTLGGKRFLSRQEIYDIENLLRFLDNQGDSHALLGALRSPMFSVTDDAIFLLYSDKTVARDVSLWRRLENVAGKEQPGQETLRRAVHLLSAFLRDACRLPIN